MLEDVRMRVFLSVCETASFTKTAKLLGVSQPAVSQNIGSLEKQLGTVLFHRLKGEVVPTDAGLAFKKYAEQISYWYSAAENMFGTEGKMTLNKPIRIIADEISAAYLLPQTLAAVSSLHPEMSVLIESADRPAATIVDEPADLEVTVDPSPETMDFAGEAKLVGVMEAAVVCSPRDRSISSAAVSESDTKDTQKPFSTIAGIHVSNRFAVWEGYMPLLTPDIASRVSMVSSSVEAIKSMLESSSRLVGILPQCSVKKELHDGQLLLMPVQLPEFTFDIHFSPRPQFAEKEICQLLKKTLKDSLK